MSMSVGRAAPRHPLVLWTDGITDRRGVAERFGQQRLEQLIDERTPVIAPASLPPRWAGPPQDFADEVPQERRSVILGVHNGDHAA